LLRHRFPADGQAALCREVVALLGYDFGGGRLDVTAHPFTIGIGPGDVRITTRYQEEYFPAALFGAIHEAGHALYEQGLPADQWGLPAGQPASLGMHESQSRLWENMIGRSTGFWRHVLPLLQARLPVLAGVDLTDFVGAINAVEPGLIRVEADEVTYNLHILLRFELELALLRGDLPVADLPAAWDEKMERYLGITPPSVGNGVMQDIHWAAGLVGYFPTYTLGNLFAAQLFAQALDALGDLEGQLARGETAPLLGWLREHVHGRGATLRASHLIHEITGSAPSPRALVDYCREKYERLYDL
jgi:carboxypeptidase Taq